MALTTEEIKLKVGLDATSVMSGLNSISGYVEKWKSRRKSNEEEYTSWWAGELKQRSELELQSEIRAATRRNRARALLRQRAADQELKIAQAQAAREKAASDFAATQQAASQGAITLTAMKALGNKAFSLLKANVYLAAAQIAREVVPSFQSIWDSIYNTGPDAKERSDELNENLSNLRRRILESGKDAKVSKRKEYYDTADYEEKRKMLEDDLVLEREAYEKNKKIQADALQDLKNLRDQRDELVAKSNEKETKTGPMGSFQQTTEAGIAAQKELIKVEEKIIALTQANAEAIIAKNNATIAEIELNKQLKELDANQKSRPEMKPGLDDVKPAMTDLGVVGNYLEGVKSRATKWQEHINRVNAFGKPVAPVKQIDPETFVQKVAIVEIKDE